MDIIQWFIDNLITNREELRTAWKKVPHPDISQTEAERIFANFKSVQQGVADKELLEKSIEYRQKMQKFQDTNRIERKTFREHTRVSNALEEYNKNIINLLKKYNLSNIKLHNEEKESKAVGVIQLSDLHFNELIDIENNKYDFEVASKRLKTLCERSKIYFKAHNISKVFIAICGDMLNSNRRLDELLNQATNRAKATLLAFSLLEQFILDLNQDFCVYVAGVTGNESRANPEMGFADIMASDNYDFTIFNFLRVAFRSCPSVQFGTCERLEQVVNIANQNILLMHGLAIKADIEKSIQQTIGKYAAKGIIVDYVLIGHIHSARVGDFYARSSSLCGANAYSDYGLGLSSRASQNIGIFYDNKTHDVMKIDLQITEGIDGYKIEKELEAYNAKSVDKCKQGCTVFKIVV